MTEMLPVFYTLYAAACDVGKSFSFDTFPRHYYISILWAGVQPTLDPYAEAFYSRPIALTLGGEEFFSVNDVCKCMRDCRVGWAE